MASIDAVKEARELFARYQRGNRSVDETMRAFLLLNTLVDEVEQLRNQQWNAERVIAWLDDPNPKPAIHAFTAGNERQIAYRFERLRERG